MPNNISTLHTAKAGKKDEFYTQLTDVERECKHYRPHFENKVVLCNCNDGEHSAFAMYFILNFEVLKLKELICTSFEPDGHGVVYRYKGEREGLIIPAIKDCPRVILEGNGGFNTPEGIALIQEADVIVTNPPFSLFREFISILMKYEKKFLVISNQNAITYKEIFPHIKENKIWFGFGFKGGAAHFSSPYEDTATSSNHIENMIRVSGVIWLTNLEHKKRHEPIDLYKKYTPEEYPKYDNHDVINVNKTADIPLDYDGVMGVPITFLDKYCPEQFEIVGEANHGRDSEWDLFIPKINSKVIFKRILIRKKQ